MIRSTRLAAALALAAGLTAAGAALAQTQTGHAAPPAASAQPSPPPLQLKLPSVEYQPATIKDWGPGSGQPTYSVDPPPDGASGIYLPAAVLGYAKSAAGCVVIGCVDGPQVGGGPATGPSVPVVPPPANPGSPEQH